MDFSSYYYYIPLNFYETPEMTLIDNEPNGDSATVLVLALAKIHTRTVTENADGTFTIVTDDGTPAARAEMNGLVGHKNLLDQAKSDGIRILNIPVGCVNHRNVVMQL